jgi:transcriptional regulator with XRE-family HTH domain
MIKIGSVLKNARVEKGMTLDDVATKSGYSKALISRIENNNVFPSIDSLSKIVEVLELSLYDVFSTVSTDDPAILRKKDRRKFTMPEGDFELELLVSDQKTVAMLPILYSGEPGSHSTHQMGEHVGHEWTFVIKGQVEVRVGSREYLLKEGDSIYFNSGIPHSYVNVGKIRAEGVVITIPPAI